MATSMKPNSLYFGDCLDVVKEWDDESVDLIYLDPPFNSKRDYNQIYKGKKGKARTFKDDLAQATAFVDTWEWNEEAIERVARIKKAVQHPAHDSISAFDRLFKDGGDLLSYLSYMAERLAEFHRLLKPTGSLYLHCDATASHFLKILLDDIFGGNNFRNEIVWAYTGPSNVRNQFPRKHDTIFFYAMSAQTPFYRDAVRVAYHAETLARRGRVEGEKSYISPSVKNKGRRSQEQVDKNFGDGKIPESWWPDIPTLTNQRERLGWPTQKPLALLERIIHASSNKGDLVLDPFCGCGTTIEAADVLQRKWIGIDISANALEVVRRDRMNNKKIPLAGVPRDVAAAKIFAQQTPFAFEQWAVTRIPGFAPNDKQVGDGGIDGLAMIYNAPEGDDICIAQVKGGTPNVDSLKAFTGMIGGGKAAMGVFITVEKWDTPTVKKCIADAGKIKLGSTEYNRLVMWTLEDFFADMHPKLPPLAHPRTGAQLQEDIPLG